MSPEFEANLLKILENQEKLIQELAASRNARILPSENGEGDGNQAEGDGNLQPSQQRLVLRNRPANQEFLIESLSSGISEFCYDAEAGVTFEAWYAKYEDLFAEDAKNLDGPAKVRLLLRNLNTVAHKKYLSYILPKKPKEVTFDETVKTLTSIFGRHTSLFNSRYQCLQLQKNPSDDFFTYAGIVNEKCEEFKLGSINADQFKCLLFVCGLSSSRDADIRTSLLSKIESANPAAPMTLRSLAEECQRLLNLKRDTAMIERTKPTVSAVKHPTRTKNGAPPTQQPTETPNTPCWRCGEMHYSKNCPFIQHECKSCKKVGHREGYCTCFSSKSGRKKKKKQQHTAKAQGVFSVNQVSIADRRKFVTVELNGKLARLQLDSAADISVISADLYKQLGCPAGEPPSINVVNASGDDMGLQLEFTCTIALNDVVKQGRCFVSRTNDLNLFGAEWIELFGLWDVPFNAVCNQVSMKTHPKSAELVNRFKEKYSTIFSESLGLCTKKKVSFTLKPGAKPVFRPKRPVPYASVEKIEAELDRLQSLGIISPVSYSEWAAPIVAVRKPNGKVRICADYSTGLNDALEPNHHPLPLPQDIFAKLADKKIFTQIDLSDAYLQVDVDEESRKMLTINTHKGLFQFNRLSPGVKPAPGEFQHIVDSMIADLDDTSCYLDDIIVASNSLDKHIEQLHRLFTRIQEYGFHLKIEKSNFFMQQIKYLGFIVDSDGIRPDPEKVKPIVNMPAPHDVQTLRSFLGAINYYGKFVKSMHELRHPLDALLKKDAKWNWSPACQRSFEEFKRILQSELLLTHYDPSLDMIVAADASQKGIGAVLLHRFPDGTVKAVCHVSRTLTDAEKNYAQGEKEGLALVFACTKFHRMIFGRRFTLQTDHKPLLGIFGTKKGIPVHTANRLQRWALTLLLYDFKIEFKATDSFGYADVLSRLIGEHAKPDEDYVIASLRLEADVRSIQAESVAALPVTHQLILQETKRDNTLQAVLKQLRDGWSIKTPSGEILQFYKRRESLYEVDGCVMFLDRIAIPEKLRAPVLKQLHAGHPGMQRMKSIARSYVYWPNIDAEIEDFVRKCSRCAAAAKAPVKTTLSSWPIPAQPWTRLHLDYAGPIRGKFFLVIVDAHSKWPEIFAVNNSTASTTVSKLREIIARFGCPVSVVTDNGTQFDSELFAKFCRELGIEHIKTPPFHPQSNGQAERFVDTLKRALLKIGGEDIDAALQVFLQTYRYTPNAVLPDNKSPAEFLLGRKVRTVFDLMMKPAPEASVINQRQNEQFDRKHGAKKRTFAAGEEVYAEIHIRNDKFWAKGVVIERKGQVVYNVLLDDPRRRGLIRSHANQLRSRVAADEPNVQAETSLPLHVLLAEFGMNQPEVRADSDPVAEEPPLPLPQQPTVPEEIPAVPEEVMAVPGPSKEVVVKRAPKRAAEPARVPSGRKRRLPSHFEFFEIY